MKLIDKRPDLVGFLYIVQDHANVTPHCIWEAMVSTGKREERS